MSKQTLLWSTGVLCALATWVAPAPALDLGLTFTRVYPEAGLPEADSPFFVGIETSGFDACSLFGGTNVHEFLDDDFPLLRITLTPGPVDPCPAPFSVGPVRLYFGPYRIPTEIFNQLNERRDLSIAVVLSDGQEVGFAGTRLADRDEPAEYAAQQLQPGTYFSSLRPGAALTIDRTGDQIFVIEIDYDPETGAPRWRTASGTFFLGAAELQLFDASGGACLACESTRGPSVRESTDSMHIAAVGSARLIVHYGDEPGRATELNRFPLASRRTYEPLIRGTFSIPDLSGEWVFLIEQRPDSEAEFFQAERVTLMALDPEPAGIQSLPFVSFEDKERGVTLTCSRRGRDRPVLCNLTGPDYSLIFERENTSPDRLVGRTGRRVGIRLRR